jgi:hypothetical protein
MQYCDSDFTWLGGLFPGVSIGSVNVYIANISNEADAGGSWSGGAVPVGVTLSIGSSRSPAATR